MECGCITSSMARMTVDRSKALTFNYAGRTYYFCSEGCREAFQANPDRYIDRTGGTVQRGRVA